MSERLESMGVATRPVSLVAAAILASLIVIVAGIALLAPGAILRSPPSPSRFPAPSVLADERAERLRLEAAQRARLSGADGGIPIEKAMSMIVERGSKAYDPVTDMAQ